MRSKVNIDGHPVHPALIPFPIAFLVGCFLANLAGTLFNSAPLWTTGWYLGIAGVITAVIAAVPGFTDYLFTVPPKSSARKRATLHMILMLASTSLVGLSLLMRSELAIPPATINHLLEGLATVLLGSGGWMGGTLAYRNQIGVDHRYAESGKWREKRIGALPADGALVAQEGDLEVNQMMLLHLRDQRIVLARTETGYAAFDDHCTHKGGSLAGGALMCGTVQCPWHGSQFNVSTGAVTAGPAKKKIGVRQVEVRKGEVWLLK